MLHVRCKMAMLIVFAVLLSACQGDSTGANVQLSEIPAPTAALQQETVPVNTAAAEPTQNGTDYMGLPPYKMSIMCGGDAAKITDEYLNHDLRKRVYKEIETFTNTSIEWIFYDLNLYNEKALLAIASGDLPSVMVSNRTPDLYAAAKKGYFWELQDVYKNYENLAAYNPITISNISYNGKMYGLPRVRDVARNGIYINQNWLENLGLNPPETVEDLYILMSDFTKKDPDGNGINDTIGMFINPEGVISQPLTWFGGGFGWVEENGELVPVELTKEYDITLQFLRKCFSEGIAVRYPDGIGGSASFKNGQVGFVHALMDDAPRAQDDLEKEGKIVDVYVTNGLAPAKGENMRFPATDGHAGMLAISKQKVKSEEELDRVLYFFDRMCEPEMLNIVNWGFEGINYVIEDTGFARTLTSAEKESLGIDTIDFRNGFNQMVPLMENPAKTYVKGAATTILRDTVAETRSRNVKYAIGNPAAGYVSETLQELQEQLDIMINTAKASYITGDIDDSVWQSEKQRWLDAGMSNVIKEINEVHNSLKK